MVKKLEGFSLVELVVVIGLLSLLMLAISGTMLMSIVSSNRIRTTTKTKQAGTYTISQIQSMLRNAKSITNCTVDQPDPSITFVNFDGGETVILSESDATGVTRIASGSGVYLTPANLEASQFSLACEPSVTEPTLIKVSFDLKDKLVSRRTTENPVLHFETSVNLRNE